uniref:Transmembrane protein 65 n=1 Tax=Panagrolaimus sp. JU765 TaxID=591449 RepID=A0AC34PUP6_9BILA
MLAPMPIYLCRNLIANGSKSSLRLILHCKTVKLPIRYSTSGIVNHLDHLRIDSIDDARTLICHLKPAEKTLLKTALKEQQANEPATDLNTTEVKRLFLVNMMPFIGFGILDNMIMILAGEYIDQSLGALLSISTMAAAALGNIISDVAGVGLAHYVEQFFTAIGIKHPPLSSEQLETAKARITINTARAVGLIIGCLIGMFPLLFFDTTK